MSGEHDTSNFKTKQTETNHFLLKNCLLDLEIEFNGSLVLHLLIEFGKLIYPYKVT